MSEDKTIVDYGRIIYARRWLIVILMVAILGFTLVNTFLTPKGYTAKATIFPMTSGESGIASFLSRSLSGVMRQDASVLIVLFKSQSMAEAVARKLRLEDYFLEISEKNDRAGGLAKTSAFLRSRMKTYINKDGAVELNLEAKTPRLAEDIVSAYIVSVSEYLINNSIPLKFVIVDPAKALSWPSSPNLKKNLLAAFIVSLVLGISFSLLDDYFRVILKK